MCYERKQSQLSNEERLTIAQEALRLTQKEKGDSTSAETKQQWSIVAIEALEDYTFDEELTAFTALDSQVFYEDNLKENE
jgi:hypothetical protein